MSDQDKKSGLMARLFGSGAEAPKAEAEQPRASWWQRLKSGLSRSSSSIGQGITDLFTKRKLDTARTLLPAPERHLQEGAEVGILAYGSSHWGVVEAHAKLGHSNEEIDALRAFLRAHPTSLLRERALARLRELGAKP